MNDADEPECAFGREPPLFLEVGDVGGTELAGELPGRAPELRLLGRIPRVHDEKLVIQK